VKNRCVLKLRLIGYKEIRCDCGIFYGNKGGCLVKEAVMVEEDGNEKMKTVELKH
jgi:hypothetical protein